jgi:hypothetical protein
MRTIVALATAVLLTLAVIVGWVARTAPYTDQAKAVTAPATPMDPFELMKKSNSLAHQQYDAF